MTKKLLCNKRRPIQNSQLTKHFLLSLKLQSATLYALAIYQAMAQLRRKSQTRVYYYKRSRGTTAKTLAPPRPYHYVTLLATTDRV